MTKYCFFGSSVTEQSKLHTTGEVVGYVDYLINNYLNQDGNKFLRIAKGNTNITNAGILFLNDIIEWKPDFCILDWCTASDPRADSASVYYVYEQLLLNRITPITVVFPRKDSNQWGQTRLIFFIFNSSFSYYFSLSSTFPYLLLLHLIVFMLTDCSRGDIEYGLS